MRRWTAAVVAVVLTACAAEGTSSDTARPTSSPDVTGVDARGVQVVDVIDGDTIEVSEDGRVASVRLIGINAPEDGECFSDQAGAALRELVDDRRVRLVRDTSETDTYGRLLRYVHVGDLDVNRELVRRGYALARRYPPDTDRADAYDRAQTQAQRDEVGMWGRGSGCVASHDTGADLRLYVEADAPGDDGQNLNGEWVELHNEGAIAVDLSGWGLKDESASHRFSFPRGVEVGPGETLIVRSGCGQDSRLELFWCVQGSAIWNNGGDTAFLTDPDGAIVATYAY